MERLGRWCSQGLALLAPAACGLLGTGCFLFTARLAGRIHMLRLSPDAGLFLAVIATALLVSGAAVGTTALLFAWLQWLDLSIRCHVERGDYDAALRRARAGAGIALLPRIRDQYVLRVLELQHLSALRRAARTRGPLTRAEDA